MRPVEVEFLEPAQPARWMWVALGIAALCAVGVVLAAVRLHAEERQLEADLAALRARQEAPRVPIEPPPRPPYEASAIAMLKEAQSDWPSILVALEATRHAGVRIVGVDISTVEARARVDVQFSDMRALLEYVDDLNAGERETKWFLERSHVSPTPSAPSSATLIAALAALR